MITIDGLVASGKTTICRRLSCRMGWDWLSTGVFYRGLAYIVNDLNLEKEDDWLQCIQSSDWKVQKSQKESCFFYKNLDITSKLYRPEIDQKASDLAQIMGVRKALLSFQRAQKDKDRGLLAEGRDCGMVIFPQAPLKIYLSADDHVRVQRRAQERNQSTKTVMEAQKQRDSKDSENTLNPSQNSVWTIRTDQFSIEEIENMIFEKAQSIFGSFHSKN